MSKAHRPGSLPRFTPEAHLLGSLPGIIFDLHLPALALKVISGGTGFGAEMALGPIFPPEERHHSGNGSRSILDQLRLFFWIRIQLL